MQNPAACNRNAMSGKASGGVLPFHSTFTKGKASLTKGKTNRTKGPRPEDYSAMSSLSPNGMLPMGSWRSMDVLNAMMVSLRERPSGWSLSCMMSSK